ncbi:MAG: GIY-YIG nuclease family protein [Gammaproteobacteria bacterium]|nr:GIY-YIG nuclease family protein [Gammaproteobacteria bacterium]
MSNTTNKPTQQWWVYMVETVSGKLYTGISTDPQRRFAEHQGNPRLGARFFRSDPAKAMVYVESQSDRASACKREAAIKKLPRTAKLALISQS